MQEKDELVAADTRRGVAVPQQRRQPHSDHSQDPVTGGVAARVVDRFETIEIDVQQRPAPPVEMSERRRQQVDEPGSVAQPGQRVVPRTADKPLLQPLTFPDVTARDNHAGQPDAGGKPARLYVVPPDRTVRSEQPYVQQLPAVPQQPAHTVSVLRLRQIDQRLTAPPRRPISEEPFDGRTEKCHRAVGIDDRDEVLRIAEEFIQAFTPPPRAYLAQEPERRQPQHRDRRHGDDNEISGPVTIA